MRLASKALLLVFGVLAFSVDASAQALERAPWNFAAPAARQQVPATSSATDPFKVPLFGDLFQFGFNFATGFNFQGGFGLQFGQFGVTTLIAAPVAVARGAFKIAENGSPFPQQRLFLTYNYYNDVRGTLDVHREILGFEMTALGQRASVEVRLPLLQNRAHTGEKEDEIGDLTVFGKWAFVRRPNGVLSGGLGLTLPTSETPTAFEIRGARIEELHPMLFQPFIGYYRAWGDFFAQGLSSVLVPADKRAGTFLFNDLGVGYSLRVADRGLRAIVPVVELHINTPVNNRGQPGFADSTNVTAGSYFVLGDTLRLGVAFGRRASGPRLFSYEGVVSANLVF